MAFAKKTWVDRLVEYAGRRKITNISTGVSEVVDVSRTNHAGCALYHSIF